MKSSSSSWLSWRITEAAAHEPMERPFSHVKIKEKRVSASVTSPTFCSSKQLLKTIELSVFQRTTSTKCQGCFYSSTPWEILIVISTFSAKIFAWLYYDFTSPFKKEGGKNKPNINREGSFAILEKQQPILGAGGREGQVLCSRALKFEIAMLLLCWIIFHMQP